MLVQTELKQRTSWVGSAEETRSEETVRKLLGFHDINKMSIGENRERWDTKCPVLPTHSGGHQLLRYRKAESTIL